MLNDGDRELYRRSTIGMCLMETRFVCAVGLLLFCGSSSSLWIFFFFLSSEFSSFSRFVVFYFVYFEIECKRLEIYVVKTCPSQQVGSEFLKLKFYMELEFLKLEMLGACLDKQFSQLNSQFP